MKMNLKRELLKEDYLMTFSPKKLGFEIELKFLIRIFLKRIQ